MIGGRVLEQEIQLPSQNSPKTDLSVVFQQYAQTDQARAQAGAQLRQTLEASASEARQSLEKEHRLVVLANELAEARRAIEARNLQIDARDRQLREMENELAMVRREIGTNIALLTELQQERDRAEALSLELPMARESPQRAINTRVTLKRSANSQTARMTQVTAAAASEQPAAAAAQGSPEAARLMVRARALLGQGNISAARTVLERAAKTGSARASFTLAETYDPVILSTWGTYGTRSDATKARELYAKAHAGGIQEAKDRLDGLGP
jgi:chromosome segregation ATPase